MPARKSDYPKNWPAIRAEIMERAKNNDGVSQCECFGECGLHSFTGGPRRCTELHRRGALFARGRVVLTIAHLCHRPRCARRRHLKAMCQRCHLRYDVALHQRHRRERRERETGQRRLFRRED